MKHPPTDFVVEQVLQSLEHAAQRFPETADESASIELAAWALLFIERGNQLDAFRQFLERAQLPASQVVRVEHTFADMAEALRWLNTPPPPVRGTLVKVAKRTYAVWSQPDGPLVLAPSFSPQELDALDEDPPPR